MKILMMAKKGLFQLTSNDTYFADREFSVVKMAEEMMAEGEDYCRRLNMSHKGFCLATLEKFTRYWPLGSYLVMKITPKIPGGITRTSNV